MVARGAGKTAPTDTSGVRETPPLWFHLLAGPNGAGKSTLYRALVREGILGPPLEFVNADLYEAHHLQHVADRQARSEAARQWADARRAELMASRTPFASETVFSHPSKLKLIEDAQRQGYTVALYIVALDDPSGLPLRVAQRVREGGHAVPTDRILARYPRTLANLAQAVNIADVSYLYDAQDTDRGGPQLTAVRAAGSTTLLREPPPGWVSRMLLG